jgi:hypothetical protein
MHLEKSPVSGRLLALVQKTWTPPNCTTALIRQRGIGWKRQIPHAEAVCAIDGSPMLRGSGLVLTKEPGSYKLTSLAELKRRTGEWGNRRIEESTHGFFFHRFSPSPFRRF